MPERPVSDPAPARTSLEEGRRERLLGLTPRAALGWIPAAAAVVAALPGASRLWLDRDAFDSFWEAL